jgi:hypothetical protein
MKKKAVSCFEISALPPFHFLHKILKSIKCSHKDGSGISLWNTGTPTARHTHTDRAPEIPWLKQILKSETVGLSSCETLVTTSHTTVPVPYLVSYVRIVHVGFMRNKVRRGKIISEYFGLSCQLSFGQMCRVSHLSAGACTSSHSWPKNHCD